jgi:chemotaxis protein methyltransferase CheR
MKDEVCIRFLQWALPRLNLRWPGFRKVRGQVCKRIGRRLDELNISDLKIYRTYLEDNPDEWLILDSLCRVTISRFYRDKGIYDSLSKKVFPELIQNLLHQGENVLSCWCIGSASGEEPYTLSLLWDLSGMNTLGLNFNILATEIDQHMISRAQKGCYPMSSIRELPSKMMSQAFTQKYDLFCLKRQYRTRVQFQQQDIRNELPDSSFNLILCRNLVFTYFSHELQSKIVPNILQRLKQNGSFVIGGHEKLPESIHGLTPWLPKQKIYRREK